MAYNAKCIVFLLLAICFCLQTHARDSKFFSKITKQNHESISMSPATAPTLAPSPSPEAEVIEHGYGLYGQGPFQSYDYPPTTTNPTKAGEDKYVSNEEFSHMNHYQESGKGKGNGVDEKQGMSDTRFLENGKYYYDPNQDVKDESSEYFHKGGNRNGNGNGNRYEMERQGMSDTRFLENGKYFHDINEEKNGHFNTNNYENDENFREENNGHFNANNYEDNENFEEENNGHFNTNNYENENENENEDFKDEKQGMSDTRFLENGKYYHDLNEEAPKKGKYSRFEIHNNGNENGNRNKNEEERLGMSDTRFLENGKYYYDVNNEKGNNNYNNHKFGVEDVGFHNNNNVEYANSYHGNGNRNEYENEEREGGYNYPPNGYHVKEGRRGYNGAKPKKFPNVYDTMEEYDREQGYIDGQDQYVP